MIPGPHLWGGETEDQESDGEPGKCAASETDCEKPAESMRGLSKSLDKPQQGSKSQDEANTAEHVLVGRDTGVELSYLPSVVVATQDGVELDQQDGRGNQQEGGPRQEFLQGRPGVWIRQHDEDHHDVP